jgi:hypothetical protein
MGRGNSITVNLSDSAAKMGTRPQAHFLIALDRNSKDSAGSAQPEPDIELPYPISPRADIEEAFLNLSGLEVTAGGRSVEGEGAAVSTSHLDAMSTWLTEAPAQERHIVQLEALLAIERSEHSGRKHTHAAYEREIAELQITLWGHGEPDDTLESLQDHIKELQTMIWQVRRTPEC